MIRLVLQAAGQLAVAGDRDRPLIEVHASDDGAGRARPDGADAGDGQARFAAGLLTVRLGQDGVDHVAEATIDVVGEHGQRRADLVGSQPGAAGDLHRVKQVGHQLRERRIEPDDLVARRPQHGIAEQAQRPDGHGAARYWLSAVSLPIRSSTR